VGVDAESGAAHSVETSTARVHDSQVRDELLHGAKISVWADKGCVSAAREATFTEGGKVRGVMRKAPKGGKLHPEDERINRIIAMVRTRVEYPFRLGAAERLVQTILWFGLLALLAPWAASAIELVRPVDCSLGETCFIQQYVDRDPGPGARDFTCGSLTYDGHTGTDFALRSVSAMRFGIDVLAAAPGNVVATRDGIPDLIAASGEIIEKACGNGVLVDHGDGWTTQYCHLKNGSVDVVRGQAVEAGHTLGQVGLSGATEYPHLHFTVRRNLKIVDPFDGQFATRSCEDGDPTELWAPGPTIRYQRGGLVFAGFLDRQPDMRSVRAALHLDEPIADATRTLFFWAEFFGVLEGDVISLIVTSPDGRVFAETSTRMTRNRARQFLFVGRLRPEGGFDLGTYRGQARLSREAGTVATFHQDIACCDR